jgi:hypothetical protein
VVIDIRSFFTDIFPIIVIIIFLPILLFLLALCFVVWLHEVVPSLPPREGRGRRGYGGGEAGGG